MKYLAVWCLIICVTLAFGQPYSVLTKLSQLDSLPVFAADSALTANIRKADSVAIAFQSKTDSIYTAYNSQLDKINAARNKMQQGIDSLNNLKIPTEGITRQLDSLSSIQNQLISEINSKVSELKSRATKELDEINLPEPLQGPFNKLKQSISEYKLPGIGTGELSLNNLDFSKYTNLKLPTLSDQLKLDPKLEDLLPDLKLDQISGLSKQVEAYSADVKQIVQGNFDDLASIDKTIEARVAGMEGVDQLQEGKAFLEKAKPDSAALMNMAKEMVQEQLLNPAMDHFAGKQAVLEQAMDKMSKLKNRYSEVKSLAELPKKLPNPLKGKPFIERLVPGITFQIQKSQYFLLDINPVLQYKLWPRISAGLGWNERIPFDGWKVKWGNERVYGPRAIVQFKWTKGITFTLQPEVMNTTVPSPLASIMGVDPAYRQWVPSVFVGIRKEFTVYKSIKGNSEVLFNLYDKDDMSPYGDRLSIRFGFDFPRQKKKVK